jgi:GNAT superfamily N-acetyltransferase
MKIWRLAQSLRIEKEILPDRCRVYLKNGDLEVGKLTIQWFDYDTKNYYLRAFKISPQFRGKGWGTKMMNEILNDSRFQDRPIVVVPEPYGEENDIGSPAYMEELAGLEQMYRKFGFEFIPNGNGMIRYPKQTTSKMITLYRGVNVGNSNGKYWTTDKEWARQFTQYGQDSEIKTMSYPENRIFRNNPLPSAVSEQDLNTTEQLARKQGFAAFWVDEGPNEPNSVYVM